MWLQINLSYTHTHTHSLAHSLSSHSQQTHPNASSDLEHKATGPAHKATLAQTTHREGEPRRGKLPKGLDHWGLECCQAEQVKRHDPLCAGTQDYCQKCWLWQVGATTCSVLHTSLFTVDPIHPTHVASGAAQNMGKLAPSWITYVVLESKLPLLRAQ